MDRQTEMNDAAEQDSESEVLARHLAAVAQDLARITELQARLFVVDLRMSRNRILGGLAIWLVALCLFVATLPVALTGLALYLAHAANTRAEIGLLWVAFAAAFLVLGLGGSGWLLLRNKWMPLNRSRSELQKTMKTFARTLSDDREFRGYERGEET